ncbi:MAG: hypothetical protein ABI415_03430 [Flavitalea sp.]
MKHLSMATLAYLLCPSLLSAQQKSWKNDFKDTTGLHFAIKNESRFYVNIHAGYALALGSTFKFYPDDVSSISMQVIENTPSKTTTYKAPTKGLGQGFRIGAGLSYIVNDFINVGIDFDYFQSTISKTRDSSFYSIQFNGSQGVETNYKERYTISYKTTLLTLSPNIMFKAISRPKWFIYNKVGIVLTFRPNSLQKEATIGKFQTGYQGTYTDSTTRVDRVYDWGIRNPSVGFMGGIGGQYRLNERIRLFTEIQFSHIVFVVRDRSLTSYKVDGKEMVNTLSLSDRQLKFQRNLSSDDLSANPNLPGRTIIQRIPITYIGAQIGVAYRF